MKNLNQLLFETWTFFKGNVWGICYVIMPFIIPLSVFYTVVDYLHQGEQGGGSLVPYMIGLAVYPIYQGAMILYLASVVTGNYVAVGEYYRRALRFWGPLLFVYIFSTVAMMVGFMLLIIPGLIIMGRVALAEFYCVFENLPGTDAFSESWKATEDTQWLLVGGILILSALTTLPIYIIQYALMQADLLNPVVSFFISIANAVLTPLVTIFAFRVYTLSSNRLDGDDGSVREP